MAKARARTVTRKPKDKWKSKQWFQILAPPLFNKTVVAETLADDPNKVMSRIASTTLQDLTGDFKLMHVKLDFQVHTVTGTQCESRFVGHSLTSDYVRRLVRRNHSKISTVVDVSTKDGAVVRVKPFAVSDRRAQSSQQTQLRNIIATTLQAHAADKSMYALVADMLDGKLAALLYKACKPIYPLRKVEVNKSEVVSQPTIEMEQPAPMATVAPAAPPATPAAPTPSPEEGGPEPASPEEGGEEKEQVTPAAPN